MLSILKIAIASAIAAAAIVTTMEHYADRQPPAVKASEVESAAPSASEPEQRAGRPGIRVIDLREKRPA